MTALVALQDVSKSYGPIQAIRNVSFDIRAGEVHALLGENGAGKSTTMRVVKGETAPTSGTVRISGTKVTRFAPAVSDQFGIAMVHQELAVFSGLTVAENILPDHPERTRLGFIDRTALNRRASERLAVFGLDIDPASKVSDLTAGQKQIVEILRALTNDRRLIILDEPTSSLNAQETTTLLRLIKQLRTDGKSVLFVSHRIPEVLDISDRITVLRDGQYIETLDNDGLTESDLITRMVGRDLAELHSAKTAKVEGFGDPAMAVQGLSGAGGLADATVSLRSGEIVGFFGLEGSGTAELSQLIFGLEAPIAGHIELDGAKVDAASPRKMIERGVTYLSPDRAVAGLFKSRPLYDSITAPILDRIKKSGMIRQGQVNAVTEAFSQKFSIKAGGASSAPSSLSGGNQQKVMMAACLTPEPKVLIANEPTRGVDVGAKVEMHRKLVDIAENGAAVAVFSSELPELISVCDRIVAMRANKIVGELAGDEISESAVMALAAGGDLH